MLEPNAGGVSPVPAGEMKKGHLCRWPFPFHWCARRDGGPASLPAVPAGPLPMRWRESPTSNHAARGCRTPDLLVRRAPL